MKCKRLRKGGKIQNKKYHKFEIFMEYNFQIITWIISLSYRISDKKLNVDPKNLNQGESFVLKNNMRTISFLKDNHNSFIKGKCKLRGRELFWGQMST